MTLSDRHADTILTLVAYAISEGAWDDNDLLLAEEVFEKAPRPLRLMAEWPQIHNLLVEVPTRYCDHDGNVVENQKYLTRVQIAKSRGRYATHA